jgi:hypothetical protein
MQRHLVFVARQRRTSRSCFRGNKTSTSRPSRCSVLLRELNQLYAVSYLHYSCCRVILHTFVTLCFSHVRKTKYLIQWRLGYVVYGAATWSLAKKENRPTVLDKRMLWRILGLNSKWQEDAGNSWTVRTLALYRNQTKDDKMGGVSSTRYRREIHTKFLSGSLWRVQLTDKSVDEWILNYSLWKYDVRVWIMAHVRNPIATMTTRLWAS